MHALLLSFLNLPHCLALAAVSDAQAESFLNAQHCLAIAAAFLGIIAACASLISSANSKAESLTKRIHDAAEEFREVHDKEAPLGEETPGAASGRCDQLKRQINYYDLRFRKVQRAQHWLFLTIGIFVACLMIIIGLGLTMIFLQIRDIMEHPYTAGILFGCIGIGLLFGIWFMSRAIYFLYQEVGDSYETLNIEMLPCKQSDCHKAGGHVSPNARTLPGMAARHAEVVGG